MFASVGDRLVVHGTHVNDVGREGEILEVRGDNGAPPYLVRWTGTGQEGLVFPGPDAEVKRADQPSSS